MRESPDLKKNLDIVYRYFSHYIRTCTSVVVAMLDVVAEGLSDESMTAMIMESGYLLDIYDRGMSVSFNHILDKKHETELEKVDIGLLLKLFSKNAISAESGVSISGNIDSCCVLCDAYSFKSLLQILLQEAVASAKTDVRVTFDKNVLSIAPDNGYNEVQPIFSIFAEIFAETNIYMSYDKNKIDLRFTDESINC